MATKLFSFNAILECKPLINSIRASWSSFLVSSTKAASSWSNFICSLTQSGGGSTSFWSIVCFISLRCWFRLVYLKTVIAKFLRICLINLSIKIFCYFNWRLGKDQFTAWQYYQVVKHHQNGYTSHWWAQTVLIFHSC